MGGSTGAFVGDCEGVEVGSSDGATVGHQVVAVGDTVGGELVGIREGTIDGIDGYAVVIGFLLGVAVGDRVGVNVVGLRVGKAVVTWVGK